MLPQQPSDKEFKYSFGNDYLTDETIHFLNCEISALNIRLEDAVNLLSRWVKDANGMNDAGLFEKTEMFLADVKKFPCQK